MGSKNEEVKANNVPLIFNRLLTAAARAADCELGVLYRATTEGLVVAAHLGDADNYSFGCGFTFLDRIQAKECQPFVLETEAGIDGWPSRTDESTSAGVVARFVVVVPLVDADGAFDGQLILGSLAARGRLSAAQHFVLGTIGAQIVVANQQSASQRAIVDAAQPQQLVSENARSTERLRLLESAVVNARDSILITEAEPITLPGPRIVYCNPAFTRTTGYTESDVLGRTPRILHGPATDRKALATLKAALQAWRPIEIELLNYKKDGTPFWVELSIVPVADETGWFTHWVSVQRDTSERKEAQIAALRAQAAEKEREALAVSLAERQLAQQALEYAATHDELTALCNRAFVMQRIDAALRSCDKLVGSEGRQDRGGAVFFLDLDGFKLVNDSFGHAVGDALLVEVATRLAQCVRPSDVLARLAGDEFVIFVERRESRDALETIARGIKAALCRSFSLLPGDLVLSCSIGILELSEAYTSASEVLRDADAAMYAAKHSGSGSFEFFQPSMHERALEVLSLQADLRKAAQANAFEVYYQPIFDSALHRIIGVEALVRWTHERRGQVSPAKFIPLAEQLGIVGAIDRWVLKTAVAQVGIWQREFPELSLHLNVNVSALELREPSFLRNLVHVTDAAGFTLSDLQIEITEGVLLDDSPSTEAMFVALRSKGVRIALDDFGTGYSSLAYLDRYPIDTLKIDRSFVMRMLQKPRTMSILRSIVLLAKNLELDVVAEGVETQEQMAALASMGCNRLQGFLLCRPLPTVEISALLRARVDARRPTFSI
ncbi:putative bifunctional diguanylate cyclase/phosphodiesterase [Burkholderia sp. PAMC 26561]|uniref:putative bifunctional diguanylate cyclase/phosphodiesterase n=1 Tax=Burkholderia sp. PAMC 26561 TaxID=1795043 RepID=UPI00076AF103|nr:EAL domain-containing protein [Burkholderia sp. PAMC 26561]AME26883.1 hypothetical protein AXG89_23115 [Burkholderia sp. PAMC 26561]AME27972.1 hypothetical protein AXG89_29565 [Burkholderia sp. PAMC 26561]